MFLIWSEPEMHVDKSTGEKFHFPASHFWKEAIVGWLKHKDIFLTEREYRKIEYNDFHKFFEIVVYDDRLGGKREYEHVLKAMRDFKTDLGNSFEDNGGTWYWTYPEGAKPGGGGGVEVKGRKFWLRAEALPLSVLAKNIKENCETEKDKIQRQ